MARLPTATSVDPVRSFLPGIGAALSRHLQRSQQATADSAGGLAIDWRSIWQPQPGPQTALLETDVTEVFYGGARYGGKALANGEPVLGIGRNNWRSIEELSVGDLLLHPGGLPTRVTGVYPQPTQPIFRVAINEAAWVDATIDHLWLAAADADAALCSGREQHWELFTTEQLMACLDQGVLLPVGNQRGGSEGRRIEAIWRVGSGPATCIRVDHPDGLFITRGLIVTHNTDGMLGDWMQHADLYGRDADGIFFRREGTNLERVKRRATELFPLLGAKYSGFAGGHWTWPNGAKLRFRHLWDEKDAAGYLSESVTWVCCEELPEWPDIGVPLKLFGILRSPAGVPVKFRGTGNPLGAGHGAVKQRYVDPAPPLTPIWDETAKMFRMFIPARLEDNPAGTAKDPGYENRLYATGGPDLIRAWRWGEWDVAAGAFFSDVWDPRRQVLPAAEVGPIPAGWRSWRSLDWGSAKPTAVLFWAEADGATPLRGGRILPRGSLVVWGEIYTLAHDRNGQPVYNKGTGASNEDLGKEIAELSAKAGRFWNGCVADPSIFIRQGGLSIYEQMQAGAARNGLGFSFALADNSRVAGWQLCRSYLAESAKERPEGPGFYVYDICRHFIRTVPGIQRSSKKPEDVDTNVEDHLADTFRYGAMAARNSGAVVSELRL